MNHRIFSKFTLVFILIYSTCTNLIPIKVGPPSDIQVVATEERTKRGEYLANHVTVCIDCHSTRNWDLYSLPIISGTEGKGGEKFDEEMGLPGTIYSKNITPHGIGDWTDGELARAIVSGVTKDDEALFLMPYEYYNSLHEEDLYSIIAYIRTLKPIEYDPPKTKLNFPVNYMVRTLPVPYNPPAVPDKSNIVEYGKYMTTISGCKGCHTPINKRGQQLPGLDYAGGFEFIFPNGTITRAVNITPDEETGIGNKSKENFIGIFKAFASEDAKNMEVPEGEWNTTMPWTYYAGMTEEDLGAIYEYLRTVTPVKNSVEKLGKVD